MSNDPTTWTEEDDARLAYEALPGWHPALFVDVFRTALAMPQPASNALIAGAFVTPESLGTWVDFSRARSAFAAGLKISMTALYGLGAPDVAYVRLVETDTHTNDSIDLVPATMHITVVWRPEIAVVPGSCWRIHHLGEPIDPGLVPRTAIGTDPRRLT